VWSIVRVPELLDFGVEVNCGGMFLARIRKKTNLANFNLMEEKIRRVFEPLGHRREF
jgi:hypothetical protein